MDKKSYIIDMFRSFFFLIDRGIYWLVEITYNLFHEVAGLGLLGNESFQRFTGRVYLLLGIFALFKISFALIGMFVNPDSFSDSKTGGGKLISKVATALVLLTLVPTIFQLGYRLQGIILENNVLPTVILGASTDPDYAKTTFENGGKMISTTIFKAFFRPTLQDSNGNIDYSPCTDCKELYFDKGPQDVSVSEFGDVLNETNSSKQYIFDYNILISTIAALITAFLLISFVFDVAIRSVKLTFLQLIAPIPIIMSVDPKKGTEGLKKWVSTTVSTYLDLFLRLIIIYFIVYILAEITKNGGNSLTIFRYDSFGNAVQANDVGIFATVFIIFGLLLFAKQAPQLIYDLLGIKPPSGGFGLNPLKKLASVPFAGKAAAYTAGGIDSKLRGKSFLSGANEAASSVPLSGDEKNGFDMKKILPNTFGEKAMKLKKGRKQRQKDIEKGETINNDLESHFENQAIPKEINRHKNVKEKRKEVNNDFENMRMLHQQFVASSNTEDREKIKIKMDNLATEINANYKDEDNEIKIQAVEKINDFNPGKYVINTSGVKAGIESQVKKVEKNLEQTVKNSSISDQENYEAYELYKSQKDLDKYL